MTDSPKSSQLQAIYTKKDGSVGIAPTPDLANASGVGKAFSSKQSPIPAASASPDPSGSKKRFGSKSNSLVKGIAVAFALIMLIGAGVAGVLISQKQRLSGAPVAPTAPQSKPKANIEKVATCSLSFVVSAEPIVCDSVCFDNAQCTAVNSAWTCVAGAWSDPITSTNLPGSGLILTNSGFVLAKGDLVQIIWRGTTAADMRGYMRVVPKKADGTPDWNRPGDWSTAQLPSTLPGTGILLSYDSVVLNNGKILQGIWRGDTSATMQGYTRIVSMNASGDPDWNNATWSGPLDSTGLPGTGLILTSSSWPLINGELGQAIWRGTNAEDMRGYTRVVPKKADGSLDWIPGGWSAAQVATNLPGSGILLTTDHFVMSNGKILQSLWRGTSATDMRGYMRVIPYNSSGNPDWNAGKCRLAANPTSLTCSVTTPTPTVVTPTATPIPTATPGECGSTPCVNEASCKTGLICIATNVDANKDGSPDKYCSVPDFRAACVANPNTSTCCSVVPTNTPVPATGTPVPPTNTPVPGATSTPAPRATAPPQINTVGCNQSCTINKDCTNSSHVCYNGACRLDSNPTDANCKPVATTTPVTTTLPKTGPEDWVNYLKIGLGALTIGAVLLLLL